MLVLEPNIAIYIGLLELQSAAPAAPPQSFKHGFAFACIAPLSDAGTTFISVFDPRNLHILAS